MRTVRRRVASGQEQGQDLVELALLLPVLLIILVIAVDLGRAYNTYMVLTNAAREGARQASVSAYSTGAIVEAALHETRNAGLADGEVTILISSNPAGYPVRVTAQHEFVLLSGVLPFARVPLSASVEMVAF